MEHNGLGKFGIGAEVEHLCEIISNLGGFLTKKIPFLIWYGPHLTLNLERYLSD